MREANCPRCIAHSLEPHTEPVTPLFQGVHEGARISKCRDCAQSYVIYFVEYRDDLLEYSCPISDEECKFILASTDHRKLVRGIVRSQSLFFRAPWTAGWSNGPRALVEPRPW